MAACQLSRQHRPTPTAYSDNLCDHLLHRVGCHPKDRIATSCNRAGLASFSGACACGTFDAGSTRVFELIVDTQVFVDKSVFDFRGYPTAPTPDFGADYEALCRRSLAHVQCPVDAMHVVGNAVPGSLATFVGECYCYAPNGWDASGGMLPVDGPPLVTSTAFLPFRSARCRDPHGC